MTTEVVGKEHRMSDAASSRVDRASAEPPALELRGITKSFAGKPAVRAVDLQVNTGEFVSIVGPSGCGKTTTLQMVGGFQRPDSGSILIHGEAVDTLPPNKRDIGMVFQSYALFPHMTCVENVAYGLKMRKVPRKERIERALAALRLVGLVGVGDRRPAQLSGGQQQRVALARALVFDPSLLLLDEPLSNLDAKLRNEMRVELKQIQQRTKASTLFVTHDQEEALSMSDRIVVMNDGRVEQIGTPREIYQAPATAFVASFLGDSNVWEGVFAIGDDGYSCTLASGLTVTLGPDAGTGLASERAMITIRPEAVRIAPAEVRPDAGPNRFSGVVTATSYLGASTEYRVLLEDAEQMRVSRLSDGAVFREGDRVSVSWDVSVVGVVL